MLDVLGARCVVVMDVFGAHFLIVLDVLGAHACVCLAVSYVRTVQVLSCVCGHYNFECEC